LLKPRAEAAAVYGDAIAIESTATVEAARLDDLVGDVDDFVLRARPRAAGPELHALQPRSTHYARDGRLMWADAVYSSLSD